MAKYMTTDEVAEYLRLKSQTLRAWRHASKGPHSFKLGSRVVYDEADVLAFIEAAKRGETP